MTDSSEPKKSPVLDFEGKKYSISNLAENTQKLIAAMRVADAQLRFHNDTIRVLSVGRQSMGLQLKELLKEATPIES